MSDPSTALPHAPHSVDSDVPDEPSSHGSLKRNLKVRHINLIALGGAIGTGLFVGTGASISSVGPGGAVLSYGIIGLAIYFMMGALGEMITHRPVAGAFETFTSDYVDPALGFTVGWMYWYSCAMTIAVELVAASIVMKYWFPASPSLLWSGAFLTIILLLNLFSARVFGEAEFWFAGIKVITVIVFLVLGVAMIIGILSGHDGGLSNWSTGEAPFVHGLTGTLSVLMVAGFSFVGIESAAVAAGEAENPRTTMPRSINSVFVRIMLFYVGAIAVVATLVAYTDPRLLSSSESNIAASPFTLVLERAGLAAAGPHERRRSDVSALGRQLDALCGQPAAVLDGRRRTCTTYLRTGDLPRRPSMGRPGHHHHLHARVPVQPGRRLGGLHLVLQRHRIDRLHRLGGRVRGAPALPSGLEGPEPQRIRAALPSQALPSGYLVRTHRLRRSHPRSGHRPGPGRVQLVRPPRRIHRATDHRHPVPRLQAGPPLQTRRPVSDRPFGS